MSFSAITMKIAMKEDVHGLIAKAAARPEEAAEHSCRDTRKAFCDKQASKWIGRDVESFYLCWLQKEVTPNPNHTPSTHNTHTKY